MENPEIIPQGEQDNSFLNAEDYIHYEYASQGQRFLNYLIDNLLMNYGVSYLTGMALGTLLALIAPDFLREIAAAANNDPSIFSSPQIFLLSYMSWILNYLIYYTICEKLFKGYTLGKIITGTRAIQQDGGELTLKSAFLRSASRLIPFELFSGFSTLTWHDKWTDTMVIKSR